MQKSDCGGWRKIKVVSLQAKRGRQGWLQWMRRGEKNLETTHQGGRVPQSWGT